MRQVYLIRHAQPDFPNGERMCLGTTDIPLGEAGREQAGAMARTLPPVTAVFASGLSRAVQTAEEIALEITVIPGLREYHMGQWDGLSFQEIRQKYPDLYEARGADPSLPPPGAEDPAEGLSRFQTAMEEAAMTSSGDIAVVSHGGIMAAFLASLGAERKKPGYAQVISLSYDGSFHIQEEKAYA